MELEPKYNIRTVSLGGGTGHFSWLRCATLYNNSECNTAISACWDGKGEKEEKSGGSSGELRVDEGILPPSDYVRCLIAMMEDPAQVEEAILLLQDRRASKHPLANLLGLVAEKNHHSVQDGIDGLRKLFRVKGKVLLPSTIDLILSARCKNGKTYHGEGDIDFLKYDSTFHLHDEVSRIYFNLKAQANPLVKTSILEAQKIIFPSGSPFTSIFPHLMIEGISAAIRQSEAELGVFFNLMTTKGEDHHLRKASRWLEVFQYYLGDYEYIRRTGRSRINHFYVHDTNYTDPEVIVRYELEGQKRTEIDDKQCYEQAPGMKIIRADLASYTTSHLFRHDPHKMELAFAA